MSIDGAGLAAGMGLFALGAAAAGGLVWHTVRQDNAVTANKTAYKLTGMVVTVVLMATGNALVQNALPSPREPFAPHVQILPFARFGD